MIAIDTNILVRVFVADDPVQTGVARQLMENQGGVFVSKSVLMETEWVLRSAYQQSAVQIHAGMSGLLGLPNLVVETPEQVFQAMQDFAAGMDFSDAIHLASAGGTVKIHTFDQRFAKLGTPQRVVLAVRKSAKLSAKLKTLA